MKSVLIILSSLLLNACGDDQITTTENATNKTAYLVASADVMPDCGDSIEGQLIYVESTEQFFYCSNSEWVEISLKGTDGKNGKDGMDGKDGSDGLIGQTGKDGENGTNGHDGINGRDGRDGRDGANGAASSVLSDKEWIHPVNGIKWFIGGQVNNYRYSSVTNRPQIGDANYICPVGSHSPSDQEYQDAFKAGLWTKLSAITVPVVGEGVIFDSTVAGGVTTTFYRFQIARSNGLTDLISNADYSGGSKIGTAICVVDGE